MQDEEWGNVFGVAPERDDDVIQVIQVIQGARLFETLDERELRTLIPLLHRRDYFPRDVIIQQGAPGAGLYIIAGGEAEVILENDEGEDIVLATLGAGRMFGEMSLLDGEPRAASVVSTARSHVLGFFKADLMDLATHSPALGFKIVLRLGQLMKERLRETLTEYRGIEQSARQGRRREQEALEAGVPASS